MLMRANDGGVDREVPVDLTSRLGRGLDQLEPLTGADSPLRHVVPMANDGFTVFAIPQTLSTALARAGTDQLRATALTWAETVSEMGDEIEPDSAVDLLERLSTLAIRRAERGLSLYCWYFAP
jgi:hypothetical protein